MAALAPRLKNWKNIPVEGWLPRLRRRSDEDQRIKGETNQSEDHLTYRGTNGTRRFAQKRDDVTPDGCVESGPGHRSLRQTYFRHGCTSLSLRGRSDPAIDSGSRLRRGEGARAAQTGGGSWIYST